MPDWKLSDVTNAPFTNLVFILGSIFLFLALAPQLANKWLGAPGSTSVYMRWIEGGGGVILILTSIAIHLFRDAGKHQLTVPTNPPPVPAPAAQPEALPKIDPERLIHIIIAEQRIYVRDSISTHEDKCFTNKDLGRFRSQNIPKQVTDKLRVDGAFINLVRAIAELEPANRHDLLLRAAQTYRKAWSTDFFRFGAALFAINASAIPSSEDLRAGQTDAGSEAERLIAESIVDLTRRTLNTTS